MLEHEATQLLNDDGELKQIGPILECIYSRTFGSGSGRGAKDQSKQ
jgi:hypothetical protein